MEQLLHYVWKHKLFPLRGLETSDGQDVEVIDPGLHNRNAGPDFFNAKVKIDGTLWVAILRFTTKPAIGICMDMTAMPTTTMWCFTWLVRPTVTFRLPRVTSCHKCV